MVSINVELRNVAGTQASAGWAGGHTVIVDRPEGRAGGQGLGFNGGQLLGLALGGCFCNDLRYVAADLGVPLGDLHVTVQVDLEGEPLVATALTMNVRLQTLDGSDPEVVISKARESCMVRNTLLRGASVSILS